MQITKEEWLAEAKRRFGEKTNDWKFKCPHCGRVQSYASIKEEVDNGTFNPMRPFPKDENGFPEITVYSECGSPGCDWVAYGLFSGPVTVIHDPSQPVNEAVKKNCSMAFEFAG